MSRAAAPLAISDGQREVLETLTRSRSMAYRVVQRAQALLLAGDGISNSEISEMAGVSRPTVLSWRGQFEKDGLVGFGEVAKGRGRKPSISEEKVAEIVDLTLHSTPEGETHWSCRSMAKRVGVSSASVQRIWSARGLKPHLVKTFKGVVALCEAGTDEIVDPGWSDRQGELVEGSQDPKVCFFFGPEFVVAAADVLDEGVSGADHPCAAETFEAAHRP
jgi:hypothetical protein